MIRGSKYSDESKMYREKMKKEVEEQIKKATTPTTETPETKKEKKESKKYTDKPS